MTDPSPGHITLPALPIVMPLAKDVMWISADGEIEQILNAAVDRLDRNQALFCHKKWTATRLGMEVNGLGALNGLDALELFAFVRPSQFCLPTAKGLVKALA